MMRKTIVRTMATSTINAFMLNIVDGQPKVENLEPLTVMGKATEKEAMKALKDKYGKNAPVTIANIDVQEDTYEISVDDFVKYAKKVQKGSEGSETENESSEEVSEGSETATTN